MELFRENHKKNFIVDVRLGFKHASDISFTEVYRMPIYVKYSQSQLCLSQKFVTDLLFLELIKNMLI